MVSLNVEMCTEGVLVISSKSGLKEYYSDKEFDYDYPTGLIPLMNAGISCPITTESGEDIELTVTTDLAVERSEYREVGKYNILVAQTDVLQVLGHGEFTQICDNHKGDIDSFDFHEESNAVAGMEPGWYLVEVFSCEVDLESLDELDEEYPELKVLLLLTLQPSEPTFLCDNDSVLVV